MASSDSDAFESADEEFDDNFCGVEKSKKQEIDTDKSNAVKKEIPTISSNKSVISDVINKSEKTIVDNQKEIRRVNTATEKPRWSKTECVTPPDREECWEFDSWEESQIAKNQNSDVKNENLLEKINTTDNKEIEIGNLSLSNKEEKLEQTDNQKEIRRVNTAIEKPRWSKTECVTPPDREGCWEFDTWEESQLAKNIETNEDVPSNIKPETTPKKNDICKTEKTDKVKEFDNEKEIKRVNTAIEKPRWSKTECVTPPDREDCWEFDSWEESQIDNNKKQTEVAQTEEAQTEDVAKQDNISEDTDGWDFDDWEVPSDENENKKEDSKTTSSFPVKDSHDNFPNNRNYVNALNRLTDSGSGDKQQSWGGWKPWGGVVSVLAKASEGVASLTTQVSHGISSVIESGIGVPDPEELARAQHKEQNDLKNTTRDSHRISNEEKPEEDKRESVISFGQIVSGVTQISNKVITGGLDTLEGIGKKTMNILQDGDPMLMNKRKLLGLDNNERPVLSQILREAKEKSEENENNMKMLQKNCYKKQIHFETLFDDYHGLVHLEALEMLSKQSTLKLQSLLTPLTGKALNELQETLNEVKELCELPEQDNDESDGHHSVDDLNGKLLIAVEDLSVKVDFKEILNCWNDNIKWLDNDDNTKSPQDIYEKGLHCLAQTTALTVNKMHKLAEILLIQEQHSTANEVDSLVQITTVLSWHISGIATKFSDKLSNIEKTDEINNLITSIFLEGSNSILYLQNAYTLFIPILQMGAV